MSSHSDSTARKSNCDPQIERFCNRIFADKDQYRYYLRICKDYGTYETAQDILMKACQRATSANTFQKDRNIRNWFISILNNTGKDYVDTKYHRYETNITSMNCTDKDGDDWEFDPADTKTPDAQTMLEREDYIQDCERIFRTLSKKHRDILTMKHKYHMSNEEIAKESGISANAVAIRLSRARKALEKASRNL